MAVSFRIGGNQVDINASELAQEQTQKELLKELEALRTALGGIKEEDRQGNNILQGIRRTLRFNQTKSSEDSKANSKSLGQYFDKAMSTGGNIVSQTTFNSAFSKFLDSIGASMIAKGFGLVNSTMIEVGETFRLTNRIGLQFGDDLVETSKKLANVGLDFGEFSKIIGTNLQAVRSLADGTTAGSKEFMTMIQSFRRGAYEFGSFSYTSSEMAELLGEELEIRRSMMDSEQFRNMTTEEFTQSMIENLKQQQAMAKVTGQDVRERIKAQMEAKKSVIAQSFLNEQSDETRKQFEAVAGALSAVPGGEQLAQAIINGIATDLPANAFAPELIAMLGSGAEDLISFITDGMATNNLDIGELQRRAQELGDNVGMSGGTLRTLAATGNQVAETILTVQQKTVRTQENIADAYEKQLQNMENLSEATKAMGNTTIELEKGAKLIGAMKLEAITKIIGDGAGSMAENFNNFNMSINKLLGGEFAGQLARSIGTVLGEMGPKILVDIAEGEAPDFGESAFLSGILAQMAGLSTIALGLQSGQLAKAFGLGAVEFIGTPEFTEELGPDGTIIRNFASEEDREMYEAQEEIRKKLNQDINLSPQSIDQIGTRFLESANAIVQAIQSQSKKIVDNTVQ